METATFRWAQTTLVALVVLLTSCVSVHRPPPLPHFQTFSVVAGGELEEDFDTDSTAELVTTGMAGGAAGGAAAGAAIGLACGPLAFFCVPIAATAGGIGGAVAGGVSRGEKRLTKEHRQEVDEALQALSRDLNPNDRLRRSLSAALPKTFESAPPAEALVRVQVKSLSLRQWGGERVSLEIVAEMETSWNLANGKPERQTNRYQFETSRKPASVWLGVAGAGFSNGLDQLFDRITEDMAWDLGYAVANPSR